MYAIIGCRVRKPNSLFSLLSQCLNITICPTLSTSPRTHWHVGFLPKMMKTPYYSSSISICLLSISLPLSLSSPKIPFSLRVCALWTKTNSSASRLHKRLVFSHLDLSLAFYELLNSTLCYADWVGAPKLIITQRWCLLHCVHCICLSQCVK